MNPLTWAGMAALLAGLYALAEGLAAVPQVLREDPHLADWRVVTLGLLVIIVRYAAGGAALGLVAWVIASVLRAVWAAVLAWGAA